MDLYLTYKKTVQIFTFTIVTTNIYEYLVYYTFCGRLFTNIQIKETFNIILDLKFKNY